MTHILWLGNTDFSIVERTNLQSRVNLKYAVDGTINYSLSTITNVLYERGGPIKGTVQGPQELEPPR